MSDTDTKIQTLLEPYPALFEECIGAFTAEEVRRETDALFFLMWPDFENQDNYKKCLDVLKRLRMHYESRPSHHKILNRDRLLVYDSAFIPIIVVALPPTKRIINFSPVPKFQISDDNRHVYEIITPWQYNAYKLLCERRTEANRLHFVGQYQSVGYTAFAWEPPAEANHLSLEIVPNGACEGRDRYTPIPSLEYAAEHSSEFFDYGINFDSVPEAHEGHIIASLAAKNPSGAAAINNLKELVREVDMQHYDDSDQEWDEGQFYTNMERQNAQLWTSAFSQWEQESLESLRENHPLELAGGNFCPTPYRNAQTSRGIQRVTLEHEHNAVVYERLAAQGGVV